MKKGIELITDGINVFEYDWTNDVVIKYIEPNILNILVHAYKNLDNFLKKENGFNRATGRLYEVF